MQQMERVAQKRIVVHYPAGQGRIVLRTELDWDRDVEPTEVSDDGAASTFTLEARRPFLYVKPCLGPTTASRAGQWARTCWR